MSTIHFSERDPVSVVSPGMRPWRRIAHIAVAAALTIVFLSVPVGEAQAADVDEGGATRATATPIPTSIPGNFTASTVNGTPGPQSSGAGYSCAGAGPTREQCWNNVRFWSYTPGADATVTIRAVSQSPAHWDNTLEVWRFDGEKYVFVTHNDDAYGLDAMVTVDMAAGTTYIIGMGGYGPSSKGIAALYFGNLPPEVPSELVASAGDREVVLTWTAPADNFAAITRYTVYTSADGVGVGTPTVIFGSPPRSEATVTGLTNGTEYSFQVTASNANGESEASAAVTATPLGAPGQPVDVSVVAGNASAFVTWSAPAHDGGAAISSYTVTASPGGQEVTTTDGSARNAVVSGLTNGESYTFTVTAVNAGGPGPASEPSAAVIPVASSSSQPAPSSSQPAPSSSRPAPAATTPAAPAPTPTPTGTNPEATSSPTPSTATDSTTTASLAIPTNNLRSPETFTSTAPPAPQPLPGVSQVDDSSASRLDVDTRTPAHGGNLTLTARGFQPGTVVDFWLHSTPLYLGSAIADVNGIAVLPVKLQPEFVGEHHVQSVGIGLLGETRNLAQPISITAPPALAATGVGTGTLLALGFLLVMVGVAGLAVLRRHPVPAAHK